MGILDQILIDPRPVDGQHDVATHLRGAHMVGPDAPMPQCWVWALSGGGSRGAFQLGAATFLMRDARLRPWGIAACSVGSVNACALAEGDETGSEKLRHAWFGVASRNDMYEWQGGWIDELDRVLAPIGVNAHELLRTLLGGTFTMPPIADLLSLSPFLLAAHADPPTAVAVNVFTFGIPAMALLDEIHSGGETVAQVLERALFIISHGSDGLFTHRPLQDLMYGLVDPKRLVDRSMPVRYIAVRLGNSRLYEFRAGTKGMLMEVRERRESITGRHQTRVVGTIGTEANLVPGNRIEVALASSAIPVVNPPRDIVIDVPQEGSPHTRKETVAFIDGGLRDVLPVDSAVEMFAEELSHVPGRKGVISILCGADYVDSSMLIFPALDPFLPETAHAARHFSLPTTAGLALDMLVDETQRSERRQALLHLPEGIEGMVIAPSVPVGSSTDIDPGLIQIQMAYGWMTAFDQIRFRQSGDIEDFDELWRSTNTIIQARLLCWKLEQFGSPLRPGTVPQTTRGTGRVEDLEPDADWIFGVPNEGAVVQRIRTLKRRISDVTVDRVRRWGLRSLPDVDDLSLFPANMNSITDWWGRFERHGFHPDTGQPTGPGMHTNSSSAQGLARFTDASTWASAGLGRPRISPWGANFGPEGGILQPADGRPATPLERTPDYVVVRLEGYASKTARSQFVPVREGYDPIASNNWFGTTAPPARFREHDVSAHLAAPGGSPPAGMVPILRFHSAKMNDDYSTADFRYSTVGPDNSFVPRPFAPDYAGGQMVGYAFDPRNPPPPDSVEIWSWFSPSRLDHATTTHPTWRFRL
jgi:NTE family protein